LRIVRPLRRHLRHHLHRDLVRLVLAQLPQRKVFLPTALLFVVRNWQLRMTIATSTLPSCDDGIDSVLHLMDLFPGHACVARRRRQLRPRRRYPVRPRPRQRYAPQVAVLAKSS
jgi:hypothetical protein